MAGRNRDIGFYRSAAGSEIDFVVETKKRSSTAPARVVCIEVKLGPKWDRKWEAPMRSLREDGRIRVDRMIGIYTGDRSYHFDGLEVLPVTIFLARLHAGDFF